MDKRTATFGRTYCFDCGTPWLSDEEIICPKCGGGERSNLKARPMQKTLDDYIHYPYPWDDIPWPQQGTVAVYGGPGTGKSSLSALIKPTWWLTKEQEPKPASLMFRRITPNHMPQIAALDTAEEIKQILEDINEGPIVIDSLTAFGLKESLEIAHLIVNWSRRTAQRAIAILQANQGGGAAGYLEIPHLFDAVINVVQDPWGVRVFHIEKSRWSGLGSTYFTFDSNGAIIKPSFNASYTVEGSPTGYYLHPYPVKGAKWSSILSTAEELGLLQAGYASAAQEASYMPNSFIEPMDVEERKKFASKAELEWLGPAEFMEMATQLATTEEKEEDENPK